jgi:hypothetical protein
MEVAEKACWDPVNTAVGNTGTEHGCGVGKRVKKKGGSNSCKQMTRVNK